MSRSAFGLRLYAVGANPRNATLNGVKVVGPVITCYVLCSLSAVAAGVFLTARVSTGDPTIGASFGLDTITAIALGGVPVSYTHLDVYKRQSVDLARRRAAETVQALRSVQS